MLKTYDSVSYIAYLKARDLAEYTHEIYESRIRGEHVYNGTILECVSKLDEIRTILEQIKSEDQ